MWLWSSTWARLSRTQVIRSTPVRPMPVMAMAGHRGHLPVPGCTGPLSICGLPVGVAVRGALEDLRGRADLGLGRLQDGVPGRSWPGRERLAEVPVVGILGRDRQALPFGERVGERLVRGGQVFDPLARSPGSAVLGSG